MGSRNLEPRDDDLHQAASILAAGLGGVVLGASVLAGRLWEGDEAPLPYVWRDVAVVHFLSALPLAATLAAFIGRRASLAAALGLSALFLGLSAAFVVAAAPADITEAPALSPLVNALLRAAPALGLALATVVPLAVLLARFNGTGLPTPPAMAASDKQRHARRDAWTRATAAGALGIVVLWLLPAAYIKARCRHDTIRLAGLLQQSRFGEAQALVRRLLALDPDAQVEGRPLQDLAQDIERTVLQLESRVAAPLSVRATDNERLDLAHDLAKLGETSAALAVLQSSPELSASGYANNLRGVIHESSSKWKAARESYGDAKRSWERLAPSTERAAGLEQATKGIAFCERKLGHYHEAEAAYLELLALSPSADTHFLLARFYEDTQQAAKARASARRAMALAPERYQREGERLIDKLVTTHFGCLGVFTAEQDSSGASFEIGK